MSQKRTILFGVDGFIAKKGALIADTYESGQYPLAARSLFLWEISFPRWLDYLNARNYGKPLVGSYYPWYIII